MQSKPSARQLFGGAALVLLAILGNYYRWSFFFHIDFLFGTIAVWIALCFYGLGWGAIAALGGASCTFFLWKHPYAIVIFAVEYLWVALFYQRSRQNLVLLDSLYWVCVGIPLVWFFYSQVLGVDPTQTQIIMLKQSVNGIFNALSASLILTYTPLHRLLGKTPSRQFLSLQQALFNLLVSFVFFPTLFLMALDSRQVVDNINQSQIQDLQLLSRPLKAQLETWEGTLPQEQQDLTQILQASLQGLPFQASVITEVGRTLLVTTHPDRVLGESLNLETTGELVPLNAETYQWLPTGGSPLFMVRWTHSWFVQEVPLINPLLKLEQINGQNEGQAVGVKSALLVLESPAFPYVKAVENSHIRNLFLLLLISGGALTLATLISQRWVRPLLQLASVTTNLPDRLLEEQPIAWPQSTVLELRSLLLNFQQMSDSLSQKFKEIQEEHRKAEVANAAKTEFLANMSHELRTPLNAILGFTQLMQRSSLSSQKLGEYVAIIQQSAEHLLNLINEVLDLSKLEVQKFQVHRSDFDAMAILDQVYRLFQSQCHSKGIALMVQGDTEGPCYIRSDAKKLRQILINLTGNAVKFTNEGSITLHLSRIPHPPDSADAPNLTLQIQVIDSGQGIEAHQLDRIFESFTQVSSDQGGTGLGLTISRRFAQLLGGDLTVTSQVNHGTTFTLTLPVETVPAIAVAPAPREQEVVAMAPHQPTYRLLVADDRWTNRKFLMDLLTPLGFEVQDAANGQEAWDKWNQWHPHLIFMDMRMPVMDGYEATQRIKSHLNGQATVIIALTASAFESDRELILAKGCDDFLRKPVKKDLIFEKLRQHLGIVFVYQDTPEPQDTPPALANLPAEALPQMSLEQLQILKTAAIVAKPGPLLELIEQILPPDLALTTTLTEMVRRYEFEAIIHWLNQFIDHEP
ncbi:MAG: hybrid sensor histidine kinase/response regulator [Prochlorotrichaceae cyanobacterium]